MDIAASSRTSTTDQRYGLALSGGGFRASFFHIGVLARLADLGLLRHIEVISTVSGGSIIGALYYLHLKKVLETKPDDQISNLDYQQIVQQIAQSFLKSSQHNIIIRTYINPLRNLLMTIPKYSQSVRIGKLYDQFFYQPVLKPEQGNSIRLRDLIIKPADTSADFYPLRDNRTRSAKVPILLINATSLNTGRNWRFEASCMGEHLRDSELALEIDKNYRLSNPDSFNTITRRHQDFELGQAISASACLPGIFNPLPIDDLYPEGISLQLIDGGVHDNQGVQGLLDKKCTHLIVSDATKQIEEEAHPTAKIQPMMERIRSILVDRIREEQLFRLLNRNDLPVTYIHLRRGLPVTVKPFIGINGIAESATTELQLDNHSTNGMDRRVQHLIARTRTHLDSFTEIEAYSLMMSGYQLSLAEFERSAALREVIDKDLTCVSWQFAAIAPWLKQPTPLYLKHLRVAGERFLKTFRLSRRVAYLTLLSLLVIFAALAGGLIYLADRSSWKVTFDFVVAIEARDLLAVVGVVLALIIINLLSKVISPLSIVRERVSLFWGQSVLPIMVWPILCLHLLIFDPIFIKLGRLSRLGEPPAPPKSSLPER